MFALDEQTQMVASVVRQWCQSSLAPKLPALEAGAEMPFELMKKMAKTFGFDAMLGAAVKKRLEKLRAGGAGDADGMVAEATKNPMLMHVVVKELSRVSPGFAMGFGVSMGLVGGAIVAKGTPEQIERWGLPLATLQQIGSWCLTEPGAGSDAFGSMRTVAVPDGAGYVLSGSKTFITNGPGADVFLVYAKIDRGEPAEAGSDGRGLGAFIVERGMPGVTVGPPFKKMGMRDSPTSEVFFDDVRLGAEHLLGGRERGRAGRSDTKDSLGTERSGVPAMAWGIIERCYDASLAYVRERRQFGRAIGEFQAVQLKITDLFLKLRTVENVVFRLAWMQQHGRRDLPFVNASKAMSAQLAVDAAMTAIQIHGGYGYMEELGLEKLARDAKLLELGAGTTDINLLAAARELIGVTE
ncbi:MAG TPA: acyl-CoA dehydrogenase family protein [Kofleriaceae bacterium]|nr:acyl-CoA dehydrogenase family protein [Kofleriaceae bacterium]